MYLEDRRAIVFQTKRRGASIRVERDGRMTRLLVLLLPQIPVAMISPGRFSLASMAFSRASRSAQIRRVCSCFFSRSAASTAVRTPGPIEADATLTDLERWGGG